MTELNSPAEVHKFSGAKGIVESVKQWAHDHLTIQGREEGMYLKKYAQIAEKLPKDTSEAHMAVLEAQLRQQAHSAAIGSIVVDALMTGGVLVGAGILLRKVDFKFPKFERTVKIPRKPLGIGERKVVTPPVAKVKESARWSLAAFAQKVSHILEGHGEDIDLGKVAAGADKVLDKAAKVKWDAPADWTEKGMDKAGKGLGKLWGWLDGALGKLADNM